MDVFQFTRQLFNFNNIHSTLTAETVQLFYVDLRMWKECVKENILWHPVQWEECVKNFICCCKISKEQKTTPHARRYCIYGIIKYYEDSSSTWSCSKLRNWQENKEKGNTIQFYYTINCHQNFFHLVARGRDWILF